MYIEEKSHFVQQTGCGTDVRLKLINEPALSLNRHVGCINPPDSHMLIHKFTHLKQEPESAPPGEDRYCKHGKVNVLVYIFDGKPEILLFEQIRVSPTD